MVIHRNITSTLKIMSTSYLLVRQNWSTVLNLHSVRRTSERTFVFWLTTIPLFGTLSFRLSSDASFVVAFETNFLSTHVNAMMSPSYTASCSHVSSNSLPQAERLSATMDWELAPSATSAVPSLIELLSMANMPNISNVNANDQASSSSRSPSSRAQLLTLLNEALDIIDVDDMFV